MKKDIILTTTENIPGIEYEIIGFPQNSFIFLPGILLLPPLAVIIAILSLFII